MLARHMELSLSYFIVSCGVGTFEPENCAIPGYYF